jgi:hypothetical protein
MFSANSSQVSDSKLFVEDVFSTYLYTGNGGTQTITNGIDLAGKGGLVWTKSRNDAGYWHSLCDTIRGAGNIIASNSNLAQFSQPENIAGFTSTGFSVGPTWSNTSGFTFASWTFRKAPKFFDVVTYTGDGTNSNRRISHNLGSEPGCIIVKRTDSTSDWVVYHRSLPATTTNRFLMLNGTSAYDTSAGIWGTADPTSTDFGVGSSSAKQNISGGTYIAYLFAHDATSDGVIQCGTFTTDGSAVASVTLGWEPQWVMVKRTDGVANWIINDNMRGMSQTSFAELFPNTSGAEVSGAGQEIVPNATGFTTSGAANLDANATYIYIAIRRGPMKTPTLGTSVFNATFGTGGGTPWFKAGFPVDFGLFPNRSAGNQSWNGSRLTGATYMAMVNTDAEGADAQQKWDYMNGYRSDTTASTAYIGYSFRRAPSFMDVVCYTGTGVYDTPVNHNLGVPPELIIAKSRSLSSTDWPVRCSALTNAQFRHLFLNKTDAAVFSGSYFVGNPTATTFNVDGSGGLPALNQSGQTYVAYLFASCPGVSKVGTYTGNGSSQTINCGFAAGARFVMIKRTDSTGDWYVWDTARGIVAGNDPHLSLNTTAAEVTTDDTIDTDSSGFVVNQVAATNVNVNAATYIYLAIA